MFERPTLSPTRSHPQPFPMGYDRLSAPSEKSAIAARLFSVATTKKIVACHFNLTKSKAEIISLRGKRWQWQSHKSSTVDSGKLVRASCLLGTWVKSSSARRPHIRSGNSFSNIEEQHPKRDFYISSSRGHSTEDPYHSEQWSHDWNVYQWEVSKIQSNGLSCVLFGIFIAP